MFETPSKAIYFLCHFQLGKCVYVLNKGYVIREMCLQYPDMY